jgi:uncharacterized protein involved in type VI secretion and phage assembly
MSTVDPRAPVFTLAVAGAPHGFGVVSFRGREQISATYSFEVLLTGPAIDPDVVDEAYVGQPAHLRLAGEGDEARWAHGVIRKMESEGVTGDREGRHHHRIWLVPTFWLLKKKKNSRIFQDLGAPEIVKAVLSEAGVTQRWRLSKTCKLRAYCVQHQETDLHFVERLLAEEGIFYFFEQPADPEGREVMVMADAASFCEPIARPVLRFWDSGGLVGSDADVRRFRLRRRVEPGSVLLEDFDFLRPSFDLSEEASVSDLPDPLELTLGAAPAELRGAAAGLADAAEEALGLGDDLHAAESMLGRARAATRAARRLARGGVAGAARELGREVERRVRGRAQQALRQAPSEVRDLLGAGLSALPGAARAFVQDLVEAPTGALDPDGIEQYDHHGEFEGARVDEPTARTHLEQHRRKLWIGVGDSLAARLVPGRRFALRHAPISGHDGQYTVLRVDHEGHDPSRRYGAATDSPEEVYRNTFQCVPAGTAFRPRRPPRRLQQVTETAIVTGPAGQEIHTDPHGRIKVQFHWDREGESDEHSSCWIRVVQPWAGAGWGFQFIPRVGMEVVVVFLGGDTDRPVVVGSVPNAEHPPPFPLPRSKSKSGIRTESTRGGGGHNELSFEDRKGFEQVHLRAEKDLDVEVRHNETRRVGANQSSHVAQSQYTVIDQSRIASIGGDDTEVVTGSATRTVGRDAGERVTHDLHARVGGRALHEVMGNHDVRTAQDHTLRVEGNLTTIVGHASAPRSSVHHTFGAAEISSEDRLDLVSQKGIHLRVGASSVHILPDRVEIQSPNISLFGGGARLVLEGDSLKGVAKERAFLKAKEVALVAQGAAVELAGGTARLTGASVALGGPVPNASEDSRYRDPHPTKIHLEDQEGRPRAHQRFVIRLPDGTERAGVLDAEGSAELEIEESGGAEILFPEVADVERGG